MRMGLRDVLEHLPNLNVVSEASSIIQILTGEADVLVVASPVDIPMLKNIPPVLLLTDNPLDVQELINAKLPGWGALPVDASEEEFGAAIHALGEGLWVGAPALISSLMADRSFAGMDESKQTGQALTARESEVLQLTAQGLANKQIALKLDISEHTVKFHLSSLYAKLAVTNRTEAVRVGARRGLVVF